MIKEKLYIKEVTINELLEGLHIKSNVNNFIDVINILENENPDASYFVDVNLSVLLKYLYDAGFDDNHIIKLSNNLYGSYIELYYLNDVDCYLLEIGIR